MKCYANVRIELPVVGDTGYCNASTMKLAFHKLGQLRLAGDEWDLTLLLLIIDTITHVELSIPSGVLETSGDITVSIEENSYEQKVIIFESRCTWSGKQAGLLGGMSGYCSFTVDNVVVNTGVYHHRVGQGMWRRDCTLDQYNELLRRSRDLFDTYFSTVIDAGLNVYEWDKNVYEWEKKFATTELPGIKETWEIWIKWLLSKEAIKLWEDIKIERDRKLEETQTERKAMRVIEEEIYDDYDDTDYSEYIGSCSDDDDE